MSALNVSLGLCLAFAINLASSAEISGILSRLYKKAANENRPLILVLDNSLKNQEIRDRAVKPIRSPVHVDIDRNVPVTLLDLLNQKRQPLKLDHDHLLLENKHNHGDGNNMEDLLRLKLRLEKEKRDRRERRERKERRENNKLLERDEVKREEINQYITDLKPKHRVKKQKQQVRSQDRDDDRDDDREDDRDDDRDQDRDEQDRHQSQNENRVLRTSVIKNLLRISNDLNCDAKDECQDECNDNYNGKKKNDCENKCEVKYDCEETEKDPCEDKDDCGVSVETGSTKGERLVTVTPKCKRC